MTLTALGINHKTAPVALREKVAFTPDSLVSALASLKQMNGIDESVIVSTCNRTEVYVKGADEAALLLKWLAEFHGVSEQDIADTPKPQNPSHNFCLILMTSKIDAGQLLNPIYLWQIRNEPVKKQEMPEVVFATGVFCVYFFLLHLGADFFGRHFYP